MSEDFPALGKPTNAISATDLSSSCNVRSSPGSPSRAKPGALRFDDERAKFPKPPWPPWAAIKVVPMPTRSARSTP